VVSRLIRVGYGPIVLPPGLRRGQSMELTPAQFAPLYQAVGLTGPVETPRPQRIRPGRPGSSKSPRESATLPSRRRPPTRAK